MESASRPGGSARSSSARRRPGFFVSQGAVFAGNGLRCSPARQRHIATQRPRRPADPVTARRAFGADRHFGFRAAGRSNRWAPLLLVCRHDQRGRSRLACWISKSDCKARQGDGSHPPGGFDDFRRVSAVLPVDPSRRCSGSRNSCRSTQQGTRRAREEGPGKRTSGFTVPLRKLADQKSAIPPIVAEQAIPSVERQLDPGCEFRRRRLQGQQRPAATSGASLSPQSSVAGRGATQTGAAWSSIFIGVGLAERVQPAGSRTTLRQTPARQIQRESGRGIDPDDQSGWPAAARSIASIAATAATPAIGGRVVVMQLPGSVESPLALSAGPPYSTSATSPLALTPRCRSRASSAQFHKRAVVVVIDGDLAFQRVCPSMVSRRRAAAVPVPDTVVERNCTSCST